MFSTDLGLIFSQGSVLWWDKRSVWNFRNRYILVLAFNCSTFQSFLWQIQKQKRILLETISWCLSSRTSAVLRRCSQLISSVTWLELLSQVEVWSLKSRSQESLQSPRVNGTENTCLHLLNNTHTTLRLYHQTLPCSGRVNRLNAGLAFSSGLRLSTILNSAKPHQECVVQSN